MKINKNEALTSGGVTVNALPSGGRLFHKNGVSLEIFNFSKGVDFRNGIIVDLCTPQGSVYSWTPARGWIDPDSGDSGFKDRELWIDNWVAESIDEVLGAVSLG